MTISNEKNQNYLAENNFLTWIFNPFFLFFAEKKFPFKQINTDSDDIRFDPKFFKGTLHKKDSEKWLFINHLPGPQILYTVFEDFNFNDILLRENRPVMPVYAITYIFSLYIAISPTLRDYFYAEYNGRNVPCFSQFLLNHVRIGALDNNYYLNEIKEDTIVDDLYGCGSMEYVSGITYSALLYEDEKRQMLIMWFKYLEVLFFENNRYFVHFVKLEKTPLKSDQKLTLTSFNQNNENFLSSSTVENSKHKSTFEMLNKSVNANLILSKNSSQLEKCGAVLGYDCQVIKNEAEEYELASQLINFMTNCSPNDLI